MEILNVYVRLEILGRLGHGIEPRELGRERAGESMQPMEEGSIEQDAATEADVERTRYDERSQEAIQWLEPGRRDKADGQRGENAKVRK